VLAIADVTPSQYAMNGRMMQADGSIVPFAYVGDFGNSATFAPTDFPVGAGTLLTLIVQVFTESGQSLWGRNWVQVQLIQGSGASATVLGTLVQSVITTAIPAAWPGTIFRPPLDGPGFPTATAFGSPSGAAGATLSITGPFRAQLLGINFLYVCSGAAGNRIPTVQMSIGGAHPWFAAVQPSIGPGVSRQCFFVPGLATADYSAVLGFSIVGLPAVVILKPTDTISLGGAGLDVGDQFQNVTMSWLRWYDL
jgi:hypothetical protein